MVWIWIWILTPFFMGHFQNEYVQHDDEYVNYNVYKPFWYTHASGNTSVIPRLPSILVARRGVVTLTSRLARSEIAYSIRQELSDRITYNIDLYWYIVCKVTAYIVGDR